MPEVMLEDISKSFGDVHAVRDLTLGIGDGLFVTLLGPSGCGKSTTLAMLAGLEPPSGGRILVAGDDVTAIPPNRRNVGMVFQSYALYPHMTVASNIGFPLKLAGVERDEARRRVEAIGELLDLSNLLARRPKELSGGQQQRVALARALVKDPSLFLLDEPLSNLDAELRVRMRSFIRKLHQRIGATTIFVTHDQEEALALSDRIAVMQQGRLVQYARPDEVYARPANLFVAAFVGRPQMSLIPGRVTRIDGELGFVCDSWSLPWPDLARYADLPQEIVLGARAEDLAIVAPDAAGGNVVRGVVSLLQPVGSDTFVEISCGELLLTARVRPGMAPAVGDAVGVVVPEAERHAFDPAVGSRLGGGGAGASPERERLRA